MQDEKPVLGADDIGFLADVVNVERLKLHAVRGFHGLDASFEEGERRAILDGIFGKERLLGRKFDGVAIKARLERNAWNAPVWPGCSTITVSFGSTR